KAVRAMCERLAAPNEVEGEAAVAKGARVRLHIEGLGSPMKARVREAAAREVEVGSNLEFLRVGRSLELEDVDHQGARREAFVDRVKVDVDPSTNVPQLVVSLRFQKEAKPVAEQEQQPEAPRTERAKSSEPMNEEPSVEREGNEANEG